MERNQEGRYVVLKIESWKYQVRVRVEGVVRITVGVRVRMIRVRVEGVVRITVGVRVRVRVRVEG